MSINLSFHGGVEGVTGSCHLLRAGGLNILIDCGFFQGGYEAEKRNSEAFGFDPASVDFLLLTHGHLDHCGRIPLLVKRGFQGKIICTSATYDLARIILLDTAQIQEEDAEHWTRINRRKGLKPQIPIYTTMDALDALRFFGNFVQYDQIFLLSDTVAVTFRDAGHILGAAFLEVAVKGEKRLLFSGDIGNASKPIVRDPKFPEKADVCILEGTYADRMHKNIDQSVEELHDAILDTCRRGGNVLIPSFAIERAQDILYYIRELYDREKFSCRVFLDSPMAIDFTQVVRRHPECFDKETAALHEEGRDPFSFPGLQLTKTPDQSRRINSIESNAVIIAGSGMCTGGRIKHHLKHHIWREESSIVFVGFQAEGTLGRRIVDGNEVVKIFGSDFRVRSKVYTIGGFSAHGDRAILLDWLKHAENPEHLFLVHGEEKPLTSFKGEVEKLSYAGNIHIPKMHEEFTL